MGELSHSVGCDLRKARPRTPMTSTKRAALYVRVSTDAQTVENQTRELRQVARRRGWEVVELHRCGHIRREGTKRTAWPRYYAQGRQPAEIRYRHGLGD